MPITDRQVRRYMEQRRLGVTQAVAAAKAGFSERTARRVEGNPVLPSQRVGKRRKRTRADPFAGVWAEEIVPLLRAIPHLRGTTMLETLQRQHPGRFADGVLRSLQRRIAYRRATEGPERELIFRQEHPPGEQALSDFTDASSLAVTIDGTPFPHLLYHFWLAFSGWQYVKAIQGGESFTALTAGLQEALWQLGAVPSTHRTDRLSAAYRNLRQDDDAAAGYRAFCDHYGLQPTRNNPGVSHENGSVEAAHGHLKTGLREAPRLLESLRTPEGGPIPPNTLDEMRRELARLAILREQIAAIEQARLDRLQQAPQTEPQAMVRRLVSIIGVGVETADMLVHQVLSRHLRDRRAVARYAGLTGSPDESGARRREKGLAKSGNARVRRGLIQLAWRFLILQKDSALAQWFRRRTEGAKGARKTTMIVALARKLLIALWRMVRTGEVPEGVVLRQPA